MPDQSERIGELEGELRTALTDAAVLREQLSAAGVEIVSLNTELDAATIEINTLNARIREHRCAGEFNVPSPAITSQKVPPRRPVPSTTGVIAGAAEGKGERKGGEATT